MNIDELRNRLVQQIALAKRGALQVTGVYLGIQEYEELCLLPKEAQLAIMGDRTYSGEKTVMGIPLFVLSDEDSHLAISVDLKPFE